ncbi:MAG: acyl-[acyl-carrier-protein] thioesterase [Myxococcaceae bacterium]|nr:acyl-[acyl-carrier-protein] thioesterase [Myxococcaceae bacterium]
MTEIVPVWTEAFRVRSYEVDARGEATAAALCNYLQEAADRHAASYGVAVDQIVAAHGETWVLHRLALRVRRPVRRREELRVETWPGGRERLYAVREYRLLDADGAAIAEGASAWLVIDPVARRLLRNPRTNLDWRSERERAWPGAFREKIAAPTGAIREAALSVRRSDIDVNAHANHVHFVSWALEAMPDGHERASRLETVEVEYVAEALAGDAVVVRAAPEAGGGRWLHELRRAGDGAVLARARSTWTAR